MTKLKITVRSGGNNEYDKKEKAEIVDLPYELVQNEVDLFFERIQEKAENYANIREKAVTEAK